MHRYILRRLLQMIPLMLGITVISFAIIQLAPGSPIDFLTGRMAPAEELARVRAVYGLDQPIHVQYWLWLTKMVRGDFGRSFIEGRPVIEMILERLPATLYLNLVAAVAIYAVALPVGIISALRQYSAFDMAVTTAVFLGLALPNFWFAMLLIYYVAIPNPWIPISGISTYAVTLEQVGLGPFLLDRARYLLLPTIVLATSGMAGLTRYMRSSMLEVIRQDYVRTAKAKGLSEKIVIYKHALRNALLPIVTLLGFELPILFSGSVIIENIFAWPGLGRLSVRAIYQRDYMVVMAFLVIGGTLMVIGNFLADLLYAVVDPRIKYS